MYRVSEMKGANSHKDRVRLCTRSPLYTVMIVDIACGQQGRLLAMQQRKRHADHDALLLQNRINLLRKEEAKVCDNE